MSRYYDGWAPYVSVAERRRKAERKLAKLRKAGYSVAPVTIVGRKIATTFWGHAWCENLESYGDYESRLSRGRSYVCNGLVVDLQIARGRITAMVSGSELYTVGITIKETSAPHWRAMCTDCAGGIDSLVELLQGRISSRVMERLCRQDNGLFPRPADIKFTCSCPDHASMCKHVAAALYGVGARLDQMPELLFHLRAVDEADLIAHVDSTLPLSKSAPGAARVLETEDISALFGLDMAADSATPASTRKIAPSKDDVPGKVSVKKAVSGGKISATAQDASPALVSRKMSAKPASVTTALRAVNSKSSSRQPPAEKVTPQKAPSRRAPSPPALRGSTATRKLSAVVEKNPIPLKKASPKRIKRAETC